MNDNALDMEEDKPQLPSDDTMKEFLKGTVAELVLHFVYVRDYHAFEDIIGNPVQEPVQYGGLTVCYSLETTMPDSNTVWVSLAWCNPNEKFKKLHGRFFAAQRYADGGVVLLRLPERGNIDRQLQELFRPCVAQY